MRCAPVRLSRSQFTRLSAKSLAIAAAVAGVSAREVMMMAASDSCESTETLARVMLSIRVELRSAVSCWLSLRAGRVGEQLQPL